MNEILNDNISVYSNENRELIKKEDLEKLNANISNENLIMEKIIMFF